MYLSYDDYIGYGGNLSSTDFNRFCFRADKEIDNLTLNRCKGLDKIPDEIKRCEFELIAYFEKNVNSGSVSAVSSFGNDGYSVSYADAKNAEQQIYDIIYTYLASTGLMYCGVE
ncbi:MAG: hypothetical protein J6S00_03600 [Clostridia bacterium]|nr:hypothetical protein [Clostridia bacterium]